MDLQKLFLSLLLIFLCRKLPLLQAKPSPSQLFREYIGGEDKEVTFSEVPIHPDVEFHFILSFAIDYTNSSSHPLPTNGNFSVYWDTENLTPSAISQVKSSHSNVKVALSLGGDTIGNNNIDVFFHPTSISSWVENAVRSVSQIVKDYNLDGIDVDYEHFDVDPEIFAECIGQLLLHLKQNNVVSFTSIAPYHNNALQRHYQALWRKYGGLIDYVNFQFYAYDKGTTVPQFLQHFQRQRFNYEGGKVLVSFGTDGSGGLSPENGFFEACERLRERGELQGIFIWSADDSKKNSFLYEKAAQAFLADST